MSRQRQQLPADHRQPFLKERKPKPACTWEPNGASTEDRLAEMMQSMDWGSPSTDNTSAVDPASTHEVSSSSPGQDISYTPAPHADDPEVPKSLRLEKEFHDKNGYNWWSPPADKIKIKGYRPPPNTTSTNPSKPVNLEDIDLTLDSRCGEEAPRDLKFTPFAGICKFPYKFVSKEWSQPLATAIFDGNKIQNRDWDLYYIFNNIDCPRPCLFVPESQFEALLDEINASFQDANIRVSQELRDVGLVIDFSEIEDPDLRPRWLGHSISRAQTDGWPNNLEQIVTKHDNMSKSKDVELFKQKMDLAYEMARNKKKAGKKAKQEQAVQKRRGMAKELMRAQKYLGLLPSEEDENLPNIASLSISALDPAKPAPHPFASEPIFIAIDVEAYEREPKVITEVGVATLDTRNLKDVAPDKNGEGWQGAIRARHFRIAEYKHFVNKDFVVGCPEHFDFGTSETIGKDKIGSKLTSCFHAPFSAAYVVDEKTFGPKIDKLVPTVEEGEEKRNIIFLGHDVDNDISYLRKIGFDPLNRGNLLETMDTRSMYQAYTHDPNPTSLGRILMAFDQAGWHLHNAGNDAVYTVQALLALAVTSAVERGSPDVAMRRTEEMTKREDVAVAEARERVKDGAEGWEIVGLGSEDEGGVKLGGDEVECGKGKKKEAKQGSVPWQGSETGFYTENGYPLNV